ncbi:MAG: DUF364 domain-containing protein [Anaerolineales bacterium]|nr:DUF364 domain-containing protein [Anaerolineales bacterium]
MYTRILNTLSDYQIVEVRIGINWTAVVVDKGNHQQCGLASTLSEDHHHTGEPTIPVPGKLESIPAIELATWIESEIPLRRSIGCAAINALLPRNPSSWIDKNAESAILEHGKGKKAALIGHFPFVHNLKEKLGELVVLDQNPIGDDLLPSAAPEILPDADLVAITGMTFINHTLPVLLSLCKPEAYVMILGPSTPLSPVLFDFGVNLLAGSTVENIPDVLTALGQGANFRQIHRAGVRLITQIPSRRENL